MSLPSTTSRFESAVLEHLDAAHNLARWLMRNDQDAQDVVQQSCMKALCAFDSFRGGDFKAWFLTIVRNTSFTQLRQSKDSSGSGGQQSLETAAEVAADCQVYDPQQIAIAAANAEGVHRAIEALPDALRETLIPREMESMSYKQIGKNGERFLDHFGKGTKGASWQSFDIKGVHFIGLMNVANISNRKTALGMLGDEQITWLQKDVEGLKDSTPIVVFAHVPLWTVYEQWGWGTVDSAQALGDLKRFGSVSVLNGHIHQILQKVEGNVTFHTARSTAFPQPAPGRAESPGPMKNIAAEKLKSYLGLTRVDYVEHNGTLATTDETLADVPFTDAPTTRS